MLHSTDCLHRLSMRGFLYCRLHVCSELYSETTGQLREILRDKIPVNQIPERLDILRARIAVVDVVRVFPHVASHQRLIRAGQRGGGAGGVDNMYRAVGLLGEPGPAGTKVADAGLGEFFLELVE